MIWSGELLRKSLFGMTTQVSKEINLIYFSLFFFRPTDRLLKTDQSIGWVRSFLQEKKKDQPSQRRLILKFHSPINTDNFFSEQTQERKISKNTPSHRIIRPSSRSNEVGRWDKKKVWSTRSPVRVLSHYGLWWSTSQKPTFCQTTMSA